MKLPDVVKDVEPEMEKDDAGQCQKNLDGDDGDPVWKFSVNFMLDVRLCTSTCTHSCRRMPIALPKLLPAVGHSGCLQ